MKEEELYLLITRYLSKQTSAEENEQLMDWMAADKKNGQVFEEVKRIWLGAQRIADPGSIHALLKLRSRIAAEDNTYVQAPPRHLQLYRLAAAAAILVVAIATWRIFYFRQSSHQVAYLKEATLSGQKKKITLADGTKVILGPESSLSYPASFDKDSRTVTVEGEAYFEVSKAPHLPFIVQTPVLTVQVLGTHFNINARDNQPLSSVALLEGAVKVKLKEKINEEYLLKPGQELSVDHNTHQVYQHALDSTAVLGWQNNVLKFKNEQFGSAANRIEKMYGVKIIFKDQAAANTRLYATFRDQSLSDVMEMICTSGVLAYHQEGDTIYVNLKNEKTK